MSHVCTCRICGTPRETRPADLWCAGPADLCDTHYNRWCRLYDTEGGITNPDAYTTALTRLAEEHNADRLVAC